MSHSRRLPKRRALTLALLAGVAALALPAAAPAASGTGWLQAGTPPRCSEVLGDQGIYGRCLIGIGPALEAPSAVTRIEGQGIEPGDLYVLTPTTAGRFSGRPAVPEGTPWMLAPGGYLADSRATAIKLGAGERLAIDDPAATSMWPQSAEAFTLLSDDGPTGGVASAGRAMVQPSAMAWFEPDGDGDGWGDDSQDNCPGVEGRRCGAVAAPAVVITAPKYVPSAERPRATWTVKNGGPTPQPFVLTLHTSVASTVTAQAGADCSRRTVPPVVPIDLMTRPTTYDTTLGRQLPRSVLADLTGASPAFEPRSLNAQGYPANGQLTICLLPALAPGAVATGEIQGGDHNTLAAEARYAAKVAAVYGGAVAQTTASSIHYSAGKPLVALKPGPITAGALDRRGRMRVRTSCKGPALLPGCRLTAVVRSRVGSRRLGASTSPVVVAGDGARATLRIKLSKGGLRWLRSHRRSQISVTVTAVRPGETATMRTTSLRPRVSSALRRALRR